MGGDRRPQALTRRVIRAGVRPFACEEGLRWQLKRSIRCSRRHFLGVACVTVGSPAFVRRRGAAEARIQEARVLHADPHAYCGWPTLARSDTGELFLAWSGGREAHVCPFGRVEWMRSRDRGETWSAPRVLHDGPLDDRDAGVLVTSKGTMLVTTFTSLAYEPILERARAAEGTGAAWSAAKLGRWNSVQRRMDADARRAALGVLALRSVDGGRSFSAAADSLVNSPHGPIQLSDGRLLYAGKDLWRSERVGFCLSEDDGESWRWLAELPTRDGDDPRQYHELHAVECTSGRLLVHIRNHNRQNHRELLQSHSDDGGITWSDPAPIGVWGLPSHLLRLRDGRVLCSYGYRREPFGIQARLSEDEGRTWSAPIVLSDDGASVDLGYPSTVQHDDGSLLTAWYEKLAESPLAVLRAADWTLA